MQSLWQWYASYVWQDVKGLDALIFHPPLRVADDPKLFARQLYHRHLAHLLANRLWLLEWQALGIAALTVMIFNLVPFSFGLFGLILGLAVAIACLILARRVVRREVGGTYLRFAQQAAGDLVRRVCLRDIPPETPPDLRDPWRHGWLVAGGRPMAAEIAETDLRSTEATSRGLACISVAISFGLIPIALTDFSSMATFAMLAIVSLRSFASPSPAALRAKLLDAAAATVGEGAAWASAGGSAWSARIEGARQAQLREAIADMTPLLHLGQATGLMAARGDPFAPSKDTPIALSLRDLMQHLLVLGGTGSGKTAGVLRPLCKQIGALDSVGLYVLDGKGSLPGEVQSVVPDLIVIEPSSAKISLVEGLSPSEIASTVAEILTGNSSAKDRFFDESAMAVIRYAAVFARREAGFSLASVWKIASEGPNAFQLAEADLSDPEQNEAVSFFTDYWPTLEQKMRSSIIATLRTWYTTITGHPNLLKWAMTVAGEGDVSIKAPLTGGRIGILAPAHRYGLAGRVALALIKARIYAGIRDRADLGLHPGETPVVMVMDEAQEIISTEDAKILAIARSLQLAVVSATQTVEGMEAQMSSQQAAQYLTLFGSVIALQNRSPKTAEMVAGRAGATVRPFLDTIPGVPTVRGAVWAQQATGRIAAARHQASMAATIEMGEGSTTGELLAAINPFQLLKKTLAGEQERPTSKLGTVPLLNGNELPELTAEPNTAIALLTRARVARRDVISLAPILEKTKKYE